MFLRTVFFFYLLQTVATEDVVRQYRGYEYCDLRMFPDSFFHAVTCRGFARFAMKVQDVDEMNDKIDAMLKKAKEEHQDKLCLFQVKTFYYDESRLLFLAYGNSGQDIAYWVTEKLSPKTQFVPFPPLSHWTLLGLKGYAPDNFNKLIKQDYFNKSAAICDPETSMYNMTYKYFQFAGKIVTIGKPLNHYVFPVYNLKRGTCDLDGEQYDFGRFDPLLPTEHGWKLAPRGKDRREKIINQQYGRYTLVSKRRGSQPYEYFAVFGSFSQESLTSYLNGTTTKLNTTYCFLRNYRLDLDEQHEPYMLPRSGEHDLVLEGWRDVTTTTTTSTTTTTTTTTRTTEVTEDHQNETMPWDKEGSMNEYEEGDAWFNQLMNAVSIAHYSFLTTFSVLLLM
uniref:Uncharacterized protein n=1 Tax=Steinernema glaseri TaxID=37863 RepID=A0A1I7XZ17_9BILA